jgi:hydroxyacylglutathione hydrolase
LVERVSREGLLFPSIERMLEGHGRGMKVALIVESLGGGVFFSNTYVVGPEGGGEGMVIDPCVRTKEILAVVKRLGLSISLIVATHAHPDHVATLAKVRDATGASFLLHEDEPVRGVTQTFGRLLGFARSGSLRALPRPDRMLRDGDTFEVGPFIFSVLHTPGHTPGGICLLHDKMLFSGDSLFNMGIGTTDYPGGDYSQMMRSICEKLMKLPDDTVVYPGHGPRTTIGWERRNNPFVLDWMKRSTS